MKFLFHRYKFLALCSKASNIFIVAFLNIPPIILSRKYDLNWYSIKNSTSQFFSFKLLKVQVLSNSLNGPKIALELIFLFLIALILLVYFSSIAWYPTLSSASNFSLSTFFIILDDLHHGKNSGYDSTSITTAYNCSDV